MKTKMKEIWLAACILMLAAAVAGADEVDQALSGIATQAVVQSTRELIESGLAPERAIAVTRAMVEHGFETQQVAEAHRVLLEARKQGLPPDPIINKALEGMAKRVPSSRVVHAMDAVRTRYDFAFQQVEKLTGQKTQQIQMGHAIAAGLSAGLTPQSVEPITDGLRERSRAMNTDQRDALALETFKMARDMARLGVSPSQTAAVICQALQHQFSLRQMQNMRTAFRNDSRSTAPQSLAATYDRSIQQGKSFEGPDGGQTGEGRGAGSTGGGSGSGSGGSGGSDSGGGSGPGGGGGSGGQP
jgi:uncharacterized membrane protein YgcG